MNTQNESWWLPSPARRRHPAVKIALLAVMAACFVIWFGNGAWEAYLIANGTREPDAIAGRATELTLKGTTIYVRPAVAWWFQGGLLSVWGLFAVLGLASDRFFDRDEWGRATATFFALVIGSFLILAGLAMVTNGDVPLGILSR